MKAEPFALMPPIKRPAGLSFSLLIASLATLSQEANSAVFADDFQSSTVENNPNGYLGGWFGSSVSFGQWVGSTSDVSISGGVAVAETTSGFRGLAIVIDPSEFSSMGAHTFSFDVTNYTGDANDTGLVRIWEASGYDLSGGSGNAAQVDTQAGIFKALGSAEVAELADFTFTSTGTGFSVDFNYDGTSAIGIFLGAETGGYPFPSVTYDNVSLSASPVIPEPTSSLAGITLAIGLVRRRNR